MLCYSNDGASMRAVAWGYVAQPGEVLFAYFATSEQLAAAFPGYVAPLPADAVALRRDAQDALARTDMVYIRCGKAGVAWPSGWQDYVVALRAIVSSPADATEMPATPAYPEGT